MSTDRIEKEIVLRAPRSRVWRALTNAEAEPTTLVEFQLEEVPGGTRLTVVESGFEGIPLARRAQAFEANEGGWTAQLENIGRHVSA